MEIFDIALEEAPRLRMRAFIHPITTTPDGGRARLRRPAVIVCPGGAYMLRAENEGDPVAMALAARGFNAFTLQYSVGARAKYPTPAAQLARAVKYIRDRAEEWDVGGHKIAVLGFSAGGHLAACLGTMFEREEILRAAGVTAEECRPDALALYYPCIIAGGGEMGELYSLLTGGSMGAEQLSCERFVSAATPPAFIAATYSDGLVPVEHALAFANAMAAHDRPFELHIFEKGNHCELNAASAARFTDETLDRNAERCFGMCADWLLDTLGSPTGAVSFPAGARAHTAKRREL